MFTCTIFKVNMLNAVTANFLGDNLQCWMQIQSGKGPWASEVSGIVKIGQTMTMVLGIKDEENKFDMVVSKHFHVSLILDSQAYIVRASHFYSNLSISSVQTRGWPRG